MVKKQEEGVTQLATELLAQLAIKPQKLTVETDEAKVLHLDLELDEADTGVLIGYHGDTISALQLILGLLLYKQTGTWTRLVVDVGEYRQKRAAALEKLALNTAQKVRFSGEPIALFNLNPFERRVIHMALAGQSGVVTESEGEGKDRHLIVRPASPSGKELPLEEPPSDEQT
jgi:spoIIIJ-associated protein